MLGALLITILLVNGWSVSANNVTLTSCEPALLQCANTATIESTDCATRTDCSNYNWQRSTKCTCPEGYTGSGCEYVTSDSICTSQNLQLGQAPHTGSGSMECEVTETSQSQILNLLDQRSILHVDLESNTVQYRTETRLKENDQCTDVKTLMSCTFSSCKHAQNDLGHTLSCSKKACEACSNCGISILSFFVSMLNSDRRPLVISFDKGDGMGGSSANLKLQTFLYSLPLKVTCQSGYCA